MTLASPEWLLLLPAFAFLAWRRPELRLTRPGRAIALFALIVLLCDPMVPSRRGGMDLWVLIDRSDSTKDMVDRELPEWRSLLERSRPSRGDRIHYIDYAQDALPALDGGGTELAPTRRGQTRTAHAIDYVLTRHDPGRPTRILAFTDGYATEPLDDVAAKLIVEGIPLDYRLMRSPEAEDYRITEFEVPSRVQAGENFLIRVRVAGTGSASALPISLRRGESVVAEGVVELEEGTGSIEWIDRLDSSGGHVFEAVIHPENDAHSGNNRATAWVEVTGGPRLLLITRHPDDPIAEALAGQGFDVDVLTDPAAAAPERLAGARALVLNNVPAFDFSTQFLESIDFFVREQGGGFLMVGGNYSFGSGGYFESPVDPLLPVSMELKSDHRRLSVAMAVVLDRSGSMMAPADGPPGTTKMDLANAGTVAAIELLGPTDAVTVFAVDTTPHMILPLTTLGGNRGELIERVRQIRSMGGGIYVYQGLTAAWGELQKATAGTRHLILFADANDAEEPGNYRELLEVMLVEGVTVSVIGLGTDRDSDADFLKDIAHRGEGRIQFTEDANAIPQIFAGETVAIARSAFIREPTALVPSGEWGEVSSVPLDWPAAIDAYNLSYARPEATVAAVTGDEYAAPLVATMRRGLGRSAAISFPMAGEHSELVRQWQGYEGFVRTLARWLAGVETPPGIGLGHRLEGTRLSIDLHYATGEWTRRLAADPPKLILAAGQDKPEVFEVPWQRLAPGHFSAVHDMAENQVIRGVVQLGEHALPFGPIATAMAAEWAFDPDRLADLRLTSRRSGGVERMDLSEAWERPAVTHLVDLRMPLAILALLMILIDAFVTKTGFRIPALPAFPRQPKSSFKPVRRQRKTKTPDLVQPVEQEQPPSPDPAPPDPDLERRRSRFDRAKRRE